jgi:hypothetical protein
MATTTTNFGWDIPQSTDLVKDGATAIAALGQDIDTAMVDLKGGTTGQVLAKASGTDLDFSWVAQDDSNAIQNAIVDAKGDLIAATANDTPARLAVGTNGQLLQADSTAATGLKWATVASGDYVKTGSATFSAQSSVSINSCFSNTYDTYIVTGYLSSSVAATISGRMRASGTDTSTNYLYAMNETYFSTSAAGVFNSTATSFLFSGAAGAAHPFVGFNFTMYKPFIASPTYMHGMATRDLNTLTLVGAQWQNSSTSFDGFSLFPNTGTITGQLNVYGLVK